MVERRRPLLKKDSRPVSMATDEPLLDPQLAAMLEARKIKAGENPGIFVMLYTSQDFFNSFTMKMRRFVVSVNA